LASSHCISAQALVGSGSTVPLSLYQTFAERYNARFPNKQMKYLPIGTSEGINNIQHNVGDFAAGEIPLMPKEMNDSGLIELPVAVVAIVPIYNLGMNPDLHFSGEVLAEIYMGHIKTWNDPKIARLNPDINLPDIPIIVFNRPAGKGSNYIFTDFLSKASRRFRQEIGVSASPSWPVGAPAERSSDIAEKVASTRGSLGYVELQYAIERHLSYGLVLNAAGNFIKASRATLTAACESVQKARWDYFAVSLTNAPGIESFPIASFTWIYVKQTVGDHPRGVALAELLLWMLADGQSLATQNG
jgi:phosphate ABC transporter phosphate-binding protein